jgi:hypothetical protein
VATASWGLRRAKTMAHVQAVGFGIGYPEPLLVSVLSSVASLSTSALAVEGSRGGYPFRKIYCITACRSATAFAYSNSPAASRASRLAENGAQYHLPRAKPPKAMSPIKAMISPSQTLQKIATTIPMITTMPPRDMPPMQYLPVRCCAVRAGTNPRGPYRGPPVGEFPPRSEGSLRAALVRKSDLLRQPGGFEGLAFVKKPAQADSAARSQLDDPRPSVIDLGPAHAPATSHVPEDQNAIAQVAEVCGPELEGFPALGHVAEELTDAARPRVVDGLASHPYEVHLEVRVASGNHRFRISGNRHHPESTPDQLDVLPRHHPCIVSRTIWNYCFPRVAALTLARPAVASGETQHSLATPQPRRGEVPPPAVRSGP